MTEAAIMSRGRFVVPELVSTNFHIREGDTIADFGAGGGYFIKVLSRLVGEEGTVYACDIQKQLVESIGELARRENLTNVSPLWCDLEVAHGSKIPDDTLDVALLINTVFQIEDKGTMFDEVKRTLRKGGKLIVVDWSESFGGLGPQTNEVITLEEIKGFAERHGFVFERTFDAGDHHYGVSFRL